jgi:hypothetical protein
MIALPSSYSQELKNGTKKSGFDNLYLSQDYLPLYVRVE